MKVRDVLGSMESLCQLLLLTQLMLRSPPNFRLQRTALRAAAEADALAGC